MLDIFNLGNCVEVEFITNILVRPGQFVEIDKKSSVKDFCVGNGCNPFGIVYGVTFTTITIAVPHNSLEISTTTYDKAANYFSGQNLYVNGFGILTCEKPTADHPVVGYVTKPPNTIAVPTSRLLAEVRALPLPLVQVKSGIKNKYTNGANCVKCQDFYPYAEESNQDDGTFKCFGCRSGY